MTLHTKLQMESFQPIVIGPGKIINDKVQVLRSRGRKLYYPLYYNTIEDNNIEIIDILNRLDRLKFEIKNEFQEYEFNFVP